jgi:hypothetical protein
MMSARSEAEEVKIEETVLLGDVGGDDTGDGGAP